VHNEIVIEAMIKGLRPEPTAQYFVRKLPQTLEKLLLKMDECIRVDNDFQQRMEEAYRYSKMTRCWSLVLKCYELRIRQHKC
jgi:hypothetical protein